MASVYNEVIIGWKGADYTIKPTFELINRIENHISAASIAGRMANGDVPTSHVALLLAEMLRYAGVKVKNEEVHQELFHGDADALWSVANSALAATFPNPKKSGE